jgi:hypothetical protein
MMKSFLSILVGWVALGLLPALPVYATSLVAVDDSVLSAISGKGNDSQLLGDSSLFIEGGDGNVQVGYFQWDDNHGADASNHKGANDQSGANNAAQANVVSSSNSITWGTYAAGIYVSAGDVSDAGVEQEAWSTMFVGGF